MAYKLKREQGKKERKVEGFWPRGNLLCGLRLSLPPAPPPLPPLPLSLSLPPLSLSPPLKSASHVKIANISKTKIPGERE